MPNITVCQKCGDARYEDRKCQTCADQVQPLTAGEEISLTNFLIALKGPVEFECEYKNWRGEVAPRRLRAVAFWHGSTEWHPTPGLMLKAVDLDKDAERDFAVADFNMTTLRAVQ